MLPGRSHSHNMAPQGNLDKVSGHGRCQVIWVSHLQFLGRPEQPGSARESACAPHPRHVRLHISCHNLSSDNFAYHAPPASFWAYQLFALSSFGGVGHAADLAAPTSTRRSVGSGWNLPATARRRIASRLSRSHPPTPIAASGAAFSRGAGPRLRGGWLARV